MSEVVDLDAEAPPAAGPLRLLAQDAEDLMILSAAIQDAAVRLADISYAPAARTLTFPLTRYRRECDAGSTVPAAVQFGDVLGVKARGLAEGDRARSCNLLAVEFHPGEPPGGAVMLHFAGCGDLRIEVECIDAALADIGEPSACAQGGPPKHDL